VCRLSGHLLIQFVLFHLARVLGLLNIVLGCEGECLEMLGLLVLRIHSMNRFHAVADCAFQYPESLVVIDKRLHKVPYCVGESLRLIASESDSSLALNLDPTFEALDGDFLGGPLQTGRRERKITVKHSKEVCLVERS